METTMRKSLLFTNWTYFLWLCLKKVQEYQLKIQTYAKNSLYETMLWYATFFVHSWNQRGMGLSPLYCGHSWPIVPAPRDRWWWLWSNWWDEDWQGKPKYSEKTYPSCKLSTTNPTWPDQGSISGRRGGKPATNRLSYGANLLLFDVIITLLNNITIASTFQYFINYT
jgi:hypothetical protein